MAIVSSQIHRWLEKQKLEGSLVAEPDVRVDGGRPKKNSQAYRPSLTLWEGYPPIGNQKENIIPCQLPSFGTAAHTIVTWSLLEWNYLRAFRSMNLVRARVRSEEGLSQSVRLKI